MFCLFVYFTQCNTINIIFQKTIFCFCFQVHVLQQYSFASREIRLRVILLLLYYKQYSFSSRGQKRMRIKISVQIDMEITTKQDLIRENEKLLKVTSPLDKVTDHMVARFSQIMKFGGLPTDIAIFRVIPMALFAEYDTFYEFYADASVIIECMLKADIDFGTVRYCYYSKFFFTPRGDTYVSLIVFSAARNIIKKQLNKKKVKSFESDDVDEIKSEINRLKAKLEELERKQIAVLKNDINVPKLK